MITSLTKLYEANKTALPPMSLTHEQALQLPKGTPIPESTASVSDFKAPQSRKPAKNPQK